MAYKVFTVLKWKKLANTANSNPVYGFSLMASNGQTISGKTKPNAGFIYSIPDVRAGEKINAELSQTPSGRVYMTDFGGRSNPMRRRNPTSVNVDIDVSSHNAKGRSRSAYATNPAKRKTAAQKLQSAIFKKANELMREGYERAQAFAVAYREKGEPKRGQAVKKNPVASRIRSRPKTGKPTKRIYTVEMASKKEGPYKTEGIFPTAASAKEYAHALDVKHKRTKYIRVTV